MGEHYKVIVTPPHDQEAEHKIESILNEWWQKGYKLHSIETEHTTWVIILEEK